MRISDWSSDVCSSDRDEFGVQVLFKSLAPLVAGGLAISARTRRFGKRAPVTTGLRRGDGLVQHGSMRIKKIGGQNNDSCLLFIEAVRFPDQNQAPGCPSPESFDSTAQNRAHPRSLQARNWHPYRPRPVQIGRAHV